MELPSNQPSENVASGDKLGLAARSHDLHRPPAVGAFSVQSIDRSLLANNLAALARAVRELGIPTVLTTVGAHYVKAFGTLAAEALARSANREPQRAAFFYATDDDTGATTVERLIRAAGFDPLKAGGAADAGWIEAPGGDLNGEIVDLEQARTALAGAAQSA